MLDFFIRVANTTPDRETFATAEQVLRSLSASGHHGGLLTPKALGDDMGGHWLRLPTSLDGRTKSYSLAQFIGMTSADVDQFFAPGWSWETTHRSGTVS